MKSKSIVFEKCYAFLVFCFFSLIFCSCSTEQLVKKPLDFKDVEREFNFSKPLSVKSQQVILKQFGSVETYRDSILVRKYKKTKSLNVVSCVPAISDSADLMIFKMDKQALEKAGIKVYIDPKVNISDEIKDTLNSVIKNKSNSTANVIVEILDSDDSRMYVISMSTEGLMLDQAEEFGAELPFSCRAGACSTCCSKLVNGYISCPEQTFYDDDQLSRGFFPMCAAYPFSQCYVKAKQESQLI